MIGVISDTHGLLRPEAVEALRGSDILLHAGDVGNADILEQLREIAPLHVIRGNVDSGRWAFDLPRTESVSIHGFDFYMIHDIGSLDLNPAVAGFDAVIYGHSHRPESNVRDGVLFFNPGSAGRRRFSLPITVGTIEITEAGLSPRIIELDV